MTKKIQTMADIFAEEDAAREAYANSPEGKAEIDATLKRSRAKGLREAIRLGLRNEAGEWIAPDIEEVDEIDVEDDEDTDEGEGV